jgi:hypothetical protein
MANQELLFTDPVARENRQAGMTAAECSAPTADMAWCLLRCAEILDAVWFGGCYNSAKD